MHYSGHSQTWLSLALLAPLLVLPLVSASAEEEESESLDSIVVTATRMGNLVRDEPIRIEVLPTEEIEENLTVQPGNLSTLLTEFGGLYTQSTGGGLNGAQLSMRGLPGRHTLVLQDGLPLLGTQTDSFGLLQVPPLDLARVEVIKGASSALYGGTALGGILNLVSRRPEGESEILLNRSSHGGTDGVAFLAEPLTQSLGLTVIAGVNDQSREDVDGDAWADLAGYRRYTVRPRLYWQDDAGRSLFATVGFADENRDGGSMPGQTLFDGTTFRDALDTRRFDAGMVAEARLSGDRQWSARWSATRTDHDREFSDERVQDTGTTAFVESTLSGTASGHQWLLGLAVQYDELDSDDAPDADYDYVVPGVFGQDQYVVNDKVTLSASGRVDFHSDYGTFFSPRISALFRPREDWSIRASIAGGFAAPTPLMDKTEATSLAKLLPWRDTVRAERAATSSLDIKWGEGSWEINASLFGSEIRDPLTMQSSASAPGRIELVNADGPMRAVGAEVLVHYVQGLLHLIGSATFLDATEADPAGGRRDSDLLPRYTGELAALFEKEGKGRFGVEASFTGEQTLFDNPYRTVSKPYVEFNALAEIRLGRASIFFNAINFTDVRQTHYDPLLLPAPAPDGERIVDSWASLAGRTFNLGVRVEL
jgi:outer membrane receptor for ferrienterochelin and colicins